MNMCKPELQKEGRQQFTEQKSSRGATGEPKEIITEYLKLISKESRPLYM